MKKKFYAILVLFVMVLMINVVPFKSNALTIIRLPSGDTLSLVTSNSKKTTWISTSNSVATVTQAGKVTGKNPGYTIIMAQSLDGIQYWYIRVVPRPSPTIPDDSLVSISDKKKNMLIGKQFTLSLYRAYEEPTSVTLDVGEAKEITLSLKSNSPTNYKISPSSIVEVEWGKLKNTCVPLTIYGLKKGKIIITVHNEETNEKLRIPVTVNQSENETTIDETVSDNEKKPKDPEYTAFQKEWLTEKSLSNYYDGHITRIYDLYLTITNKDGIQASYDITNCPKTRLEPGVIYEGTCGTSTIRFQFIKELELDGIKYEFNCICLNMEDLRNADIIR